MVVDMYSAKKGKWSLFPLAGNPDGMKVAASGHIFATGPGGVLVFSPEGEHLGTLLTGKKTGNLAFGGDGYLYITADDSVLRVRVHAKPVLQLSMIS